MNIEEIRAIIALFETSSLTTLKIKTKDQAVEMSRLPQEPTPTPVPPAPTPTAAATDADEVIAAPMVGTFYQAAHPGDAPLVSVGDTVNVDTTVCVLEAMKVFTEVPANRRGTITEILAHDGDFVEYGQPLFKVKVR